MSLHSNNIRKANRSQFPTTLSKVVSKRNVIHTRTISIIHYSMYNIHRIPRILK